MLDFYYRKFITSYNSVSHKSHYEPLQTLVENIYTNVYLAGCLPSWNKVFCTEYQNGNLPRMRDFYKDFIKNAKEKTAVIISDALRYEVAVQLFNCLDKDQNLSAKMEARLGELPSFTSLGMAALLPHKSLDLPPDGLCLVDGQLSSGIEKRESILRNASSKSRCVNYNDLFLKNNKERRAVFTGMEVVYIYHNQIDARGENTATENEVFTACEEAVSEIQKEIKRLSTGANIYNFIITADHGFIYKRNKITESDKISIQGNATGTKERRFFIADREIKDDGIASLPLAKLLNNDNPHYIVYPIGANVFKAPGGQNYVHGASSPQELIIPVITVKAERYHVETSKAEIKLNTAMTIRISNLITSFEFFQTEPVTDEVKEQTYKVCIIDKEDNIISDEREHTADSKDADPRKRCFRLSFNLKNKKYSVKDSYYLIIRTDTYELSRTNLIIDIPFADNFGFFAGEIE
jgi:uncharacterized protein (TIGR02687 family)